MADLLGAVPYLEVFDMTASVAFYRDCLGFEVLFASPEVETSEGRFSHFMRLRRGGVELMLNTAYDSNERPPGRTDARWAGCQHVQFYIDCDDVLAFYAEATARGLQAEPPATTPYGYLGFWTADPDGHRLMVHQPR